MYFITHPPWRLHHQPLIFVLPYPVGWTVNHPCLYSPSLSAALSATCLLIPLSCRLNCRPPILILSVPPSVTHLFIPLPCQLQRQSCISLLTHLVSCTVSEPSLYSSTVSAGWLTTHLFMPPPCRTHCQSSISLPVHHVGCTVTYPS